MHKTVNQQYEEFLHTIEAFVFVENKAEKADIIFVPGNGYPQMAEKAAELFQKGYAPWILPSGRHSIARKKFSGVLAGEERYHGDYETEWEFLQDVLIKNGVPREVILREDQATYTYENALKSKMVLEEHNISVKKAILCCKTHHARRCLMYYQRVFPEVEFIVVPVDADGVTKENWKEASESIHAVMGEAQRIVEQFEIYMK